MDRALRALGALLTYPRPELVDALPEIAAVLGESPLVGRPARQRLGELVAELARADPYEREERYVALFDRGRARSLHLFEHVHGESRDRGPAMVDLHAVYERAGFRLAPGELPDYLPALLEFLSCRPLAEARATLADCAHVLRPLGERLAGLGSRYAAVFDALLGAAGEPGLDWSKAAAPAEPDEKLDDDWMDAPAFGPGSERNSGAHGTTAVMHFVPRKPR
jgi:nitrate reductase delta subunit